MSDSENKLDELLKSDRYSYLRHFPKSMALESIREDLYTDFVLNFLIEKGGKGKITQLLLDVNDIDFTLDYFMIMQKATSNDYATILKENKNYVKLDITRSGIRHYEHICSKYKINVPTLRQRIKRYTLNLRKKIFSLVFISADNKINNIMESGITKLILFIIALLGLIIAAKSAGWL